MDTKMEKLVNEFYALCHQSSEENPNVKGYMKAKTTQLFDSMTGEDALKINWKDELIEAFVQMKAQDEWRLKLTVLCEEIISNCQKTLKSKDLELEMLANELSYTKSSLEQERAQNLKQQKDHEQTLQKQKLNTIRALEKLEYKEYQLRQMEQKVNEYEQEIEEIKSSEYQNMINSIKEEEIMNSQAQNLYKENTLLKYQLKEETLLKNQLTKHIKTLNEEIEHWKDKYEYAKVYIRKKINPKRSTSQNPYTNRSVSRDVKQQQEQTINLIDFKDDFSFKDSIQNDSNSIIIHNNVPSFLDLQSHSEFLYEESPDKCLMERDVLNLTDRDRSTHSRNITKHLVRSKKRYLADKQNVSENTWDYQEFDQYQNDHKISNFGSKCQVETQQNCSISKYVPSPRNFGTQERQLLSKHRRIKSSFCGKSIQEFHEYETNSHFIMNSEKLRESIFENEEDRIVDPLNQESGESKNNLQDESSILAYDVNQIVINEELITSQKVKNPHKQQETPQMFNSIEARMITSVQIPCESIKQLTFSKPSTPSLPTPPPMDPYYAFFSLTAQCVKLNAKSFNRAISVYFNLEEEYNNVIKKTIPINKWYNYINDQIETALKYMN